MYRIQLQHFEGPLDLLLFFIRRDELDVYDIPIARITDEYLAYVRVMEEVDLDGVADFIYMAAILIGIKAKMLLPRPDVNEEGEPIDPRTELVQRLLEYMRYKEAATHLEGHYEARGDQFVRGAASAPPAEAEGEPSYRASVFDLIGALKRVLETAPPDVVVHPVAKAEFTMEEQQAFLMNRVQEGDKVSFIGLMESRPRAFIVATFLAVLELIQRRALRVIEGVSPDDFRLARGDRPPVHPSLKEAVSAVAPGPEATPPRPAPRSDRAALRALNATRPTDG